MKVPKARKLKSGTWFIQLRLGGESIPVNGYSEKEVTREAQRLKAEYLAGKRLPAETTKEEQRPVITLDQAIKEYCDSKSNVLSPATIRGYHTIRKNQFKSIMQRNIYDLVELSEEDWQRLVNDESAIYSAKTLKNAVSFIKTVIQKKTKRVLPEVTLEAPDAKTTNFLTPDEIKIFVKAVYNTDIAVIALLALSSMRLSEIQALDWKYIKKSPEFIHTNGAVVPDEYNQYKHKEKNKNVTSTRNIPVLIPELAEVLERDRKDSGPVMDCSRSHFLKQVHRICAANNITDITIHGLRHSFASLAYHLKMPEKIAMEIGGWDDPATMHNIYTHIAKQDITRYKTVMAVFYEEKTEENANKNANRF